MKEPNSEGHWCMRTDDDVSYWDVFYRRGTLVAKSGNRIISAYKLGGENPRWTKIMERFKWR